MSRRAKRGKRRATPPARPVPRPPARPAPAARETGLAARTARGKPIEDRPKAPWHPVPLVELCVLVGIVLIVLGLIVGFDSDRGQLALVCGVLLASLGGLDTAVREHFNGYKSHSSVLAGLPGVIAAAALFFARAPWLALLGGTVAVFAGVFWWMRRVFMRRASRARRARG